MPTINYINGVWLVRCADHGLDDAYLSATDGRAWAALNTHIRESHG